MDPVLVGTVSLALAQVARMFVEWQRARVLVKHERARGEGALAVLAAALPAGSQVRQPRPDGTVLVLTVLPRPVQS